jgi:hypothetical protein
MTRRAEAEKHTGTSQCVGSASWTERYPKWPPRYVAFALAHGATDLEAFRASQASRAPFNAWIAQQELLWRASVGYDAKRPLTPRRLAEFERWLEQRASATPEHIAPIVDRVMAGILSKQVGRTA